jgi:hypothetical protein
MDWPHLRGRHSENYDAIGHIDDRLHVIWAHGISYSDRTCSRTLTGNMHQVYVAYILLRVHLCVDWYNSWEKFGLLKSLGGRSITLHKITRDGHHGQLIIISKFGHDIHQINSTRSVLTPRRPLNWNQHGENSVAARDTYSFRLDPKVSKFGLR